MARVLDGRAGPRAAAARWGQPPRAAPPYVRGIERAPSDFVNVVIPEIVQGSASVGYLFRRAALVRLKAGLLREPNIVVTDVPVVVRGRAAGRRRRAAR